MITLSFVGSAIAGWMVWAYSSKFTGEIEPWDAQSNYYSASIIAIGFLGTLLYPKKFWIAPIGLILGQIFYMEIMYHPFSAVILPAWIAVPMTCAAPAFVGSGIAFGLVLMITRTFNRDAG